MLRELKLSCMHMCAYSDTPWKHIAQMCVHALTTSGILPVIEMEVRLLPWMLLPTAHRLCMQVAIIAVIN